MPGSTPAGSESLGPISRVPPRAGYAPAPARVCAQPPFAITSSLLPRLIRFAEVVTRIGDRERAIWLGRDLDPLAIRAALYVGDVVRFDIVFLSARDQIVLLAVIL